MEWVNRFMAWEYSRETMFLIALVLILGAWKFGIEGLLD